MTERITADDLRTAAEFVGNYLTDPSQTAIADRLEAHADVLPKLQAVLDALSGADLDAVVELLVAPFDVVPAQIMVRAARLKLAADALHALEAERPAGLGPRDWSEVGQGRLA
jgi:hypothetical protein